MIKENSFCIRYQQLVTKYKCHKMSCWEKYLIYFHTKTGGASIREGASIRINTVEMFFATYRGSLVDIDELYLVDIDELYLIKVQKRSLLILRPVWLTPLMLTLSSLSLSSILCFVCVTGKIHDASNFGATLILKQQARSSIFIE